MPLVYQQNINPGTRLGVWQISEDENFFFQQVAVQRDITHPHKRLQHLAGRYVLKQLFDDFPTELIEIADTRKPYLPGEKYHFSISHCASYAAVIVSTHNRVGVDIELPQEKIARIQEKFLTTQELALCRSLALPPLQSLTMAWSIKEAMFKWYGYGEVDFKRHLIIKDIVATGDSFTSQCRFAKNEHVALDVHSLIFDGVSLAFLLT